MFKIWIGIWKKIIMGSKILMLIYHNIKYANTYSQTWNPINSAHFLPKLTNKSLTLNILN